MATATDKKKVVTSLAKGDKNMKQLMADTGLERDVINAVCKELVLSKEAKLDKAKGVVVLLVKPEPAPAPAKKKAPTRKKAAAKKPEPELDEFDEILDADEEVIEEDVPVEDDDEYDSDDFDGDDDSDTYDDDHDTDDEVIEEEVVEKPKKTRGRKPAPKREQKAAHSVFSMPFKPIDTLTDDELLERVERGTQAAELLFEDDEPVIAELVMRSVAKARRQLNKRS